MCVGSEAGADGKKHYALNSLRHWRKIVGELSRMEQSNDYQYQHSLNIFSLTLGPFERDASRGHEGAAEDADEDFVQAVQKKAITLQISRLGPKGAPEGIWDLHDNYLDYDRDKTAQIIKCIERPGTKGRKEQYVVILMEKLLGELAEPYGDMGPHWGNIRITMTVKEMKHRNL